MTPTEITKEMLFNYFSNRATALQKRMIDEWAKDRENRELFFQTLAEWEKQNTQYTTDVDTALQRHWARMQRQLLPAPSATPPSGSFRYPSWTWRIAALLVVGLTITLYFTSDRLRCQTMATSFGETKTIRLSDGSSVILNANSSLSIPRFGFGDYTRNVLLTGEANFSVTHQPGNQKFVVRTEEGLDIVVLGTEFNVYSRQRGSQVVLNKGKIQLSYRENRITPKQLIMYPGELVTIDKNGRAQRQKTQHPEKYSAWKDHRYVFERTSMEDLCRLFEENFGVRVALSGADISSWTVSGAFAAANAEELLEALSESSGLMYSWQADTVVIRSLPLPRPKN